MAFRLFRHRLAIWRLGAPDIVISHAPPRLSPTHGDRHGPAANRGGVSNRLTEQPSFDWPDPGHRGYYVFGNLIRHVQPRVWLHGHTHLAYGTAGRESRLGATRVINVYGHCVIDL
jgi:Icc-related predicted phosphoesterase